MTVATDEAAGRSTLSLEALRVQNWRLHCLTDMGLMVGDARALSESGADLHSMLALLRNGCPVETLRRIML